MIIYSVVPMDIIFQDTEEGKSVRPVKIQYMGEIVEAVQGPDARYTISRIISTSPKAYLNPKLQPGQKVDISQA